ncbi:PEP-CTERM putative exosortase interaction domain-containing protein [Opitutaceae bacterium TAV1]|nr:PEP-CTERM putative exosortase interaction domain-containing protein [Opitutaceae bacterium TAV1]
MKTYTALAALLVAAFALAASPLARAALIVGEDFESYADGRLSTVSASTWSSTSQSRVASSTGIAFEGTHYAEIGTSTANQTASRTFSGVPTTGTYWVQFSVQNVFTQAQLGPDNYPQIRLSDGTSNLITLLFRPDNSNIVINYAPTAGSAATPVTTSINYDTASAWHTFTYAIDLATQTASIYADGQTVVASFSFTGYGSTFSTIDFRGALPTAGTALRVDSIGFYNASPLPGIPEPATIALLGGLSALALGVLARRHRKA